MQTTEHEQSLDDFRSRAAETFERLNRTGEAEVLTVDGTVQAVLLSPAAYDELAREAQLTRDAAAIRRAIAQLKSGDSQEAGEVFGELRAKLLAMKAAKENGGVL